MQNDLAYWGYECCYARGSVIVLATNVFAIFKKEYPTETCGTGMANFSSTNIGRIIEIVIVSNSFKFVLV